MRKYLLLVFAFFLIGSLAFGEATIGGLISYEFGIGDHEVGAEGNNVFTDAEIERSEGVTAESADYVFQGAPGGIEIDLTLSADDHNSGYINLRTSGTSIVVDETAFTTKIGGWLLEPLGIGSDILTLDLKTGYYTPEVNTAGGSTDIETEDVSGIDVGEKQVGNFDVTLGIAGIVKLKTGFKFGPEITFNADDPATALQSAFDAIGSDGERINALITQGTLTDTERSELISLIRANQGALVDRLDDGLVAGVTTDPTVGGQTNWFVGADAEIPLGEGVGNLKAHAYFGDNNRFYGADRGTIGAGVKFDGGFSDDFDINADAQFEFRLKDEAVAFGIGTQAKFLGTIALGVGFRFEQKYGFVPASLSTLLGTAADAALNATGAGGGPATAADRAAAFNEAFVGDLPFGDTLENDIGLGINLNVHTPQSFAGIDFGVVLAFDVAAAGLDANNAKVFSTLDLIDVSAWVDPGPVVFRVGFIAAPENGANLTTGYKHSIDGGGTSAVYFESELSF